MHGQVSRNARSSSWHFLPGDRHVVATISYTGATKVPASKSICDGQQIIIIKVDGTVFRNGDACKCLTCGISAEDDHSLRNALRDHHYPQAFADGKRNLSGAYIIDCGELNLTGSGCTSSTTSIYPIRFENNTEDSGPGTTIRELGLHPDQTLLGFNSFLLSWEAGIIRRHRTSAAPKTGVSSL